jgi:hypothetical protein
MFSEKAENRTVAGMGANEWPTRLELADGSYGKARTQFILLILLKIACNSSHPGVPP